MKKAAGGASKTRGGRELWKWRGCGKRGKPKAGFPLFPRALGNLAKRRRDSHISTAPVSVGCLRAKSKQSKELRSVGRGKVEIQEQDSHFSTAPRACGSKEKGILWRTPQGVLGGTSREHI
jgi:hypothetical protein